MTVKKATEDQLGLLHLAVATTLCEQVTHKEQETRIDEDGNLVETGREVFTASPATIAAAIKFLKDNNITCEIDDNTAMGELREKLKNKQLSSRMGNPSEAAKAH